MAKIGYLKRRKIGVEQDGSFGWHYVQFTPPDTEGKALCGAHPTPYSTPWSFDNTHAITCVKCINIMRAQKIDRYSNLS